MGRKPPPKIHTLPRPLPPGATAAWRERRRRRSGRARPPVRVQLAHVERARVRALAVDAAEDQQPSGLVRASGDERGRVAAAVRGPMADGVRSGPPPRRGRVVVQVVEPMRLAVEEGRAAE